MPINKVEEKQPVFITSTLRRSGIRLSVHISAFQSAGSAMLQRPLEQSGPRSDKGPTALTTNLLASHDKVGLMFQHQQLSVPSVIQHTLTHTHAHKHSCSYTRTHAQTHTDAHTHPHTHSLTLFNYHPFSFHPSHFLFLPSLFPLSYLFLFSISLIPSFSLPYQQCKRSSYGNKIDLNTVFALIVYGWKFIILNKYSFVCVCVMSRCRT